MSKLKVLFIFFGIASAFYVIIWNSGTGKLVANGIEFAHAEMYTNPKLLQKTGDLRVQSEIRRETEKIGNKFFVRIYEDILAGGQNATAVIVVKNENGEWSLWSFDIIKGGRTEQLVEYGQFK